VQSASERQGEQNVPSPLHTPARGAQYVVVLLRHCWVGSQSAFEPHSGAQTPVVEGTPPVGEPKSQCWA
jgi:hypothetical protein